MADARTVWNQGLIPVVLRRNGPIRVRLPYAQDNRQWLQAGHRAQPAWIPEGKYWELPRVWFSDFVDAALIRFGQVWIIAPHREKEVCAPACWNAQGHECQCSCLGANHGMGANGNWFVVSETFAVRWGERQLGCRLLTRSRRATVIPFPRARHA